MTWVRRHLRAGTTAWLLAYAVSFVALVPRDCCAAHAHRPAAGAAAAHAAPPCHEAAETTPPAAVEDGAHCPMPAHGSEGAACPMHGGRAGAAAPSGDCMLAGVCNVPAAALAVVVMNAAVPASLFSFSAPVPSTAPTLPTDERLLSRLTPPDAPPPRL